MTSLTCLNCGATNIPDNSVLHVACKFCKTAISVVAFFNLQRQQAKYDQPGYLDLDQEEAKRVSRLLKDAEMLLLMDDHRTAKDRYGEVLKIVPADLSIRLNYCRCFLLDHQVEPLARAQSVHKLIATWSKHEVGPEEAQVIRSIAFDIASLGEKSKDATCGINLILVARQIDEQVVSSSESIIAFGKSIAGSFEKKISDGVSQSGGKFSPNNTDLEILITSGQFSDDCKAVGKTYSDWLSKNSQSCPQRVMDRKAELDAVIAGYTGSYFIFKKGLMGFKRVQA